MPGSNTERLGVPLQAELARRRHVTHQRRRGNYGRTREIPFPADPHAVLPVAVERGDRTLAGAQRVWALPEAGPAPGLSDFPADRAEHFGNRLAAEPRIGALDLPA